MVLTSDHQLQQDLNRLAIWEEKMEAVLPWIPKVFDTVQEDRNYKLHILLLLWIWQPLSTEQKLLGDYAALLVHTGFVCCCFHSHRTLTWTTGALMYVHDLFACVYTQETISHLQDFCKSLHRI